MAEITLTTDAQLSQTESYSLSSVKISDVNDADAVAMADISGDGSVDVVGGSGANGGVFWFEQGTDHTSWAEHTITTSLNEVEGAAAADIDGDGRVEVFICDQGAGTLYVAKQDTSDPTGSWSTYSIDTNAYFIQTARIWDIDTDGTDDVVFAYTGSSSGEGGVYWLDYNGGDPTDSANYTRYEMAQHEGAWFIDYNRIDLSGDGNATDIVFGSREYDNSSNSGSSDTKTGAFWLEEPSDPTSTWTVHTITNDRTIGHVSTGDLTGDGVAKDVLGRGVDNSVGLWWYEYPGGDGTGTWSEATLSTDDYWGGRTVNWTGQTRHDIIAQDRTNSDLELWVYDSGYTVKDSSLNRSYMDTDYLTHDFTGDGNPEVIAPAADTGTLEIYEIQKSVSGASVEVTVHEDSNNDGAAENTDTQNIGDGTNTYTLAGFDGGSGNEYWLTFDLSTDNGETPTIVSAKLDI